MYIELNEFTSENFSNFLCEINKLQDGEDLNILIDSTGGSVDVGVFIQHILNKEKLKRKVEISAVQIMSAAFELFYNLDVPKNILEGCSGMVHHIGWDIKIGHGGVPRGNYEKFKKTIQDNLIKSYSFLTEKEKEIYDNGDDVWLSYERLREIFS